MQDERGRKEEELLRDMKISGSGNTDSPKITLPALRPKSNYIYIYILEQNQISRVIFIVNKRSNDELVPKNNE